MTNKHVGTIGVTAAAEGRLGDAFAGSVLGSINSDVGERVFQRVIVEEVIFDPSILDDKRIDSIVKEYGIQNEEFLKNAPVNTIIGKRVIDSSSGTDSVSQCFFPFFSSHMLLPIKAGEHVWVFFEPGKIKDYGFWMSRIHEPRNVEDVNHTHADRKNHVVSSTSTIDKFEGRTQKIPSFANGVLIEENGQNKNIASTASLTGDANAYEKIISESDAGKVSDMEEVPRYKKRPGDYVLQGSNNSLIVLGTDRAGSAAEEADSNSGKVAKKKPTSDKTGKAGTVDIVVGRGQNPRTAPGVVQNSLGKNETQKDLTKENANEGNPDFEFDSGRIYISMNSDVDENFNINLQGISKDDPGSFAVIKVDHVRIIARKTIKYILQPTQDTPENECAGIVIKDGNIIFIPADNGLVKLGGDDANLGVLCTPLATSENGSVSAPPIVTSMGATVGTAGPNGVWAKKIVVK